jgi:hypothetical protein
MRTVVVVSAVVALSLSSAVASAQGSSHEPASWGLELRLNSYRPYFGDQVIPNTDRTERNYFAKYFGKEKPMLVAVEIDRYFSPFVGLLGVYARFGHWKITGKSRVCHDAAGATIDCTPETVFDSTAGNTVTAMEAVPLSVGVAYRFDWFFKKWGVPAIPYGKAAVDYYLWWFQSAGKTAVFRTGKDAKGGTAGVEAAGGLALNLDWIDPHGSNQNAVFLNSALFIEYNRTWADGFGDKAKPDMSATQLTFGLTFDFQ